MIYDLNYTKEGRYKMYNNMVEYYDARKSLQDIYRHDTNMDGDINGEVFNAMNRFKYIDKIESAIQDLKVNVVLKENTSEKQRGKVQEYITGVVSDFIKNNAKNINGDDNMKKYIKENSDHLFDYKEVGNAIEIDL